MGVFAKAKAAPARPQRPPFGEMLKPGSPSRGPRRLRRAGPRARIACAACACRPTFPASALQIFHFL